MRQPRWYYILRLAAFGLGLCFRGRPRGRVPRGTFQYGELHLAHLWGAPSTRRTHLWPHRKHLHHMLEGIVIQEDDSTIFGMSIYFFLTVCKHVYIFIGKAA